MMLDILLCGIVYTVLLAFVFLHSKSNGRRKGPDNDDDGGLPVNLPPDIDLPPGICLPDDMPKRPRHEPEEVFV